MKPLEPIYEPKLPSLLIFHGKLAGTDANDNVGQLAQDKDNAFAQSIGSIGHHQISFLQIKDFQMLILMTIRHFDLRKPP